MNLRDSSPLGSIHTLVVQRTTIPLPQPRTLEVGIAWLIVASTHNIHNYFRSW
jgi:hypothetical protein